MQTIKVKPTNKIHVSLELDETEAKLLFDELVKIANQHSSNDFRFTASTKLVDALLTALRDHENGKQMWRVEIKTALGSKRGEFLVQNDMLKSTVEAMAIVGPNFIYDCHPVR